MARPRSLHVSLRPATNAVLAAVWAALAIAASLASGSGAAAYVILGALGGVGGGALQWVSIARARDTFARATSAREVRRALLTSDAGKMYLFLFWGFALVVVFAPVLRGSIAALAGRITLLDAFAGPMAAWFAFAAARDAVTVLPTARLAARAGG